MENKKRSTKKTNTSKIRPQKVVSSKKADQDKNLILKIVLGIIIIAIIIFLLAKACTKTEKKSEKNNKEDKVPVVEKINEDEDETQMDSVATIYDIKSLVVESKKETNVKNVTNEVASEEIKDVEAPKVYGFENGTISNSFSINAVDASDVVATIDGIPYEIGTIYNVNGDHTLVVTDKAGNTTTTTFTVANIVDGSNDLNSVISSSNEGDIIYMSNSEANPVEINKSVTIRSSETASINAPINITAGNVVFDGVTISNAVEGANKHIVNVNTTGSFTMEDTTFDSNTARVGIYIENATSVSITGNTFENTAGKPNMNNLIEFGGSTNIKNGTTISNNVFKESAGSNNLISMYNFDANAVVEINDNYFEKSANAIRIANREMNNQIENVVINMNNNRYDTTDSQSDYAYAGLLIIQPWTSTEDFDGMTVNINNTINNSGKEQLLYAYNTNLSLLPLVNVNGNPVVVTIR